MKKIISIVLAVMFVAAAFCTASFAAGPPLTKAEIKTLMKAAEFMCDMYRMKEWTAGYAEEMIYTVAELFPETVVEEYEGIVYTVAAFDYQIRGAVNHRWGFMSDKTLNEQFMVPFEASQSTEDGKYVLMKFGHGAIFVSKDAWNGIYLGYAANKDGSYTVYYSTSYPDQTVGEFLGYNAEKFWNDVGKQNYPERYSYGGDMFYSFAGDYYHLVTGIRKFVFKFTESGLIEYISDEWSSEGLLNMRMIGGDINGDGEVDNKDVVALFKYASGGTVEINVYAGDVNTDYYIDNKDVVVLFRYCSGDTSIVLNDTPHPAG